MIDGVDWLDVDSVKGSGMKLGVNRLFILMGVGFVGWYMLVDEWWEGGESLLIDGGGVVFV